MTTYTGTINTRYHEHGKQSKIEIDGYKGLMVLRSGHMDVSGDILKQLILNGVTLVNTDDIYYKQVVAEDHYKAIEVIIKLSADKLKAE